MGNAFPAACVGDAHTCPLSDGPKPHVGAPVLPPGAMKTLLAGRPAARITDLAACTAPAPDIIAEGEPTVLVEGLPLARITAKTAHGGLVVGPGAPTVLLGPPSESGFPKSILKLGPDGKPLLGPDGKPVIQVQYSPGIIIGGMGPKDTPESMKETVEGLDAAKKTELGKKRLEEFEKKAKDGTGKPVVLSNHAPQGGSMSPKEFDEKVLGAIEIKVNAYLYKSEQPRDTKYAKLSFKVKIQFTGKLVRGEGQGVKAGYDEGPVVEKELGTLLKGKTGPITWAVETKAEFKPVAREQIGKDVELSILDCAVKIEGSGKTDTEVYGKKVEIKGAIEGAGKPWKIELENGKPKKPKLPNAEIEVSISGAVEGCETKYGQLGGEVKVAGKCEIEPKWAEIIKDATEFGQKVGRFLFAGAPIILPALFAIVTIWQFAKLAQALAEYHGMNPLHAQMLEEYCNGFRTGMRTGNTSGGGDTAGYAGSAYGKVSRDSHQAKWNQDNALAIADCRASEGANAEAKIQENFKQDLEAKLEGYVTRARSLVYGPMRNKLFCEFVASHSGVLADGLFAAWYSTGKDTRTLDWRTVPPEVVAAYRAANPSKVPSPEQIKQYGTWKAITGEEPAPPSPEEVAKKKEETAKRQEKGKEKKAACMEWMEKTKNSAFNWVGPDGEKLDNFSADWLDRDFRRKYGYPLPHGSSGRLPVLEEHWP